MANFLERIKHLLSGQPSQTEVDLLDKISKEIAEQFIMALGGKENLTGVDYCITRLRLNLANLNLVDFSKLEQLGSKGNVAVNDNELHVILGKQSGAIAESIKAVLEKK